MAYKIKWDELNVKHSPKYEFSKRLNNIFTNDEINRINQISNMQKIKLSEIMNAIISDIYMGIAYKHFLYEMYKYDTEGKTPYNAKLDEKKRIKIEDELCNIPQNTFTDYNGLNSWDRLFKKCIEKSSEIETSIKEALKKELYKKKVKNFLVGFDMRNLVLIKPLIAFMVYNTPYLIFTNSNKNFSMDEIKYKYIFPYEYCDLLNPINDALLNYYNDKYDFGDDSILVFDYNTNSRHRHLMYIASLLQDTTPPSRTGSHIQTRVNNNLVNYCRKITMDYNSRLNNLNKKYGICEEDYIYLPLEKYHWESMKRYSKNFYTINKSNNVYNLILSLIKAIPDYNKSIFLLHFNELTLLPDLFISKDFSNPRISLIKGFNTKYLLKNKNLSFDHIYELNNILIKYIQNIFLQYSPNDYNIIMKSTEGIYNQAFNDSMDKSNIDNLDPSDIFEFLEELDNYRQYLI